MSDFTIALEKSCRSYAEQHARIVRFLRLLGFDYRAMEDIFTKELSDSEMIALAVKNVTFLKREKASN